MIRYVALLIALLVAGMSHAQGVSFAGGAASGVEGGNLDARDVVVCLIPDTQNAVSQNDMSTVDEKTSCAVTTGFCTGGSCTASPFCSSTWVNTGHILMQNLAFSLTGQTPRIDYSAIKGGDNVKSDARYPTDHPPCDIILSMGDMADIPSDDAVHANNFAIETYTYAQLVTAGYGGQVDRVNAFWDTIKASGKPYLPLQGNHDNWATWNDMITRLGIESESWFYSIEPTYRKSLAILVPNATTRPICVIGVSWADMDYDATATPTRGATILAWLNSTWGCGGDHPTIYVQHDIVSEDQDRMTTDGGNYLAQIVGCSFGGCSQVGTAGRGELFFVAGGHHLTQESRMFSYTGLFGADADSTVLMRYQNFQEANRHNTNDGGNGITPSDGNGTLYSVVTIQPQRDQICAHDWNPYWQTRLGSGNGQVASSTTTEDFCIAFDYDAKYGTPIVGTVAANFTARTVQGSTCVAPCAVHFDAYGNGTNETTDTAFTNEFNSLLYAWDFDDPGSGAWPRGADVDAGLAALRNVDTGPVAGHVYETAGTYDVTLTVTNPAGNVSTRNEPVTVVAPGTHYAAASTYCFANDDSNWTGCPLDCAGADAEHCTVVNGTPVDGWEALSLGNNCNGADDCANLDAAAGGWVLFRRGDTFSYPGSAANDLAGSTTVPTLMQAFGTGAKPIFTTGTIDFRDGWTVQGIQVNGSLVILGFVGQEVYGNFLSYQNTFDSTGMCFEMPGAGSLASITKQLVAIVENDCLSQDSNFVCMGDYGLMMANDFDAQGFDHSNPYQTRAQQMRRTVWSRNDHHGGHPSDGLLQFRAEDNEVAGTEDQEAHEFNYLAYNIFSPNAGEASYNVRVCDDSGCNCVLGTASCAANGGETIRVRNWIFDSNLWRFSAGTAAGKASLLGMAGGFHTVRNNVAKVDSSVTAAQDFDFVTAVGKTPGSGPNYSTDIRILNNTVFVTTPSYSGTVNIVGNSNGCAGGCSGCTSNCSEYGNLLVVTSSSGAALGSNGSYTRSGTPAIQTSDIFDGTMPAQGSGAADDFVPSIATAPVNAGHDFSAETSFWNYTDALGLCRPDATEWDAGALERGAAACP